MSDLPDELLCGHCRHRIIRHSISAYVHEDTGGYWCATGPYRASPDRPRMLSLTTRPTTLRTFHRQLENTHKPRKTKRLNERNH